MDAGDSGLGPGNEPESPTPTPEPTPEPAKPEPKPELPLVNRSDFLGLTKKPRKIKLIEIENFGRVHVRALTTSERDKLEATFVKSGKGGRQKVDTVDMRAKTIQAGLINPDGTLMFSVNEIPEIGKLPAIISDQIYDEILKLSRMDRDAVEEEEKN